MVSEVRSNVAVLRQLSSSVVLLSWVLRVPGGCGVCGAVWLAPASLVLCARCGVLFVWCGVLGVVCCAWCGIVWCGVVWCGVVWCGVVWAASAAALGEVWCA